MYVHIGQKPYGKCDVVPELFYVATFFFHINFVPLIPLGTKLVLGKIGDQYRVVDIPFSFKSLLYAWARAGLVIASITFAILTLVNFDNRAQGDDFITCLAFTGLFAILAALLMIYPVRKLPPYERACQLAFYAGLNDTGWAALNVLYGRDPFDRPTQSDTLSLRQ